MRKIRPGWMGFTLMYYGANAVWQGYLSLYYAHLGFGPGRIGMIAGASALCALLVQPLWGMAADRARRANRLLSLLCLASAAALLPALAGGGFGLQLMLALLFYGFYCALLPMGDALLLQALNHRGLAFGPYRLAGALSFAICGGVFGRMLEATDPQMTIWTAAALLLAAGACALRLPPGEGSGSGRFSFGRLFRERKLLVLLAFMAPVQMTMGCFYALFAPHFASLEGGSGSLLGLSYALATLSELPYLLLSDRIFARFGAARPMCVSAAVLAIRWLLLGTGSTAHTALASQLLHGGGFIVMSVSMARFIAAHVPKELQASGQMLLSMVSFGAARAAGSLGGGFLAERIGSAGLFRLCALVCLLAFCGFVRYAFRGKTQLSNYCSNTVR